MAKNYSYRTPEEQENARKSVETEIEQELKNRQDIIEQETEQEKGERERFNQEMEELAKQIEAKTLLEKKKNILLNFFSILFKGVYFNMKRIV